MTYAEAEKRRRRRTGGSGASFGIFKCFRPTVDDDVAVHKAEDAGPASAAEKMAPLPPPFPVQAEEIRIDKKGRRGILAAIKALFFETSLGKKNRKSKRSRDLDASSLTGPSERSDSMNRSGSMTDSSILDSSLSLDSSQHSSLSSSSISYDNSRKPSRSSSLISNQRQHSWKGKRSRADHGLCMFFVTLLVVVLWGRICAIICTSTWLYFTTHRSIRYSIMNSRCSAMDSAEYKEWIILGGFLDRKRSQSLARVRDY